jgi:hypothetical protein
LEESLKKEEWGNVKAIAYERACEHAYIYTLFIFSRLKEVKKHLRVGMIKKGDRFHELRCRDERSDDYMVVYFGRGSNFMIPKRWIRICRTRPSDLHYLHELKATSKLL